jgi:4-amino-4-deoxy-L-arabinose transferase-like glycosyltransferase
VFGNHPWAIRLPALIAGILLVPATYLAARILYGRSSALLAAALVATSSTLIEYSTNARGYTGVALIFILLVALGAHLQESWSPAEWAAFAILAALGFFTIPTMLYGVGAVLVWLVCSIAAERRRELLRARLLPTLAAAAVLTLLLYAPVIAASGVHSLADNSFVAPQTWSYFAHHLPSSLHATFVRWHRDQPLPLWVLLALGFVVGLVLHRRLSPVKLSPAVGALAFIPPVLVLQHVVPFERVWLFLLPLYLMTSAAGLLFLVRRLESRKHYAAAIAGVAVALCASLAGEAVASRAVYRSEDTSTFRDAPKVVAFLQRYLRPGDRVLVSPPADLILEYYLDAKGFDAGRLLYTDFTARRLLAVVKQGPREYTLREVIREHVSPTAAGRLRPLLLRRYAHTLVYELVRRQE